jgi:PTH1 family peptidyl-tRNA hydrolase
MFLIVGLGNPGAQYARTRHNAGWFVIDELARRHTIDLGRRAFEAKMGSGMVADKRVTLVKPQTYMNLSGKSVAGIAHYHQIPVENVLVICDDLNLPLGRLRLRAGGSDGGHNGLKSIHQMLASKDYPRLRFGVGEPPREERQERGTKEFVLAPFSSDEWPVVDKMTFRAADCVELFTREGVAAAMNKYNREETE